MVINLANTGDNNCKIEVTSKSKIDWSLLVLPIDCHPLRCQIFAKFWINFCCFSLSGDSGASCFKCWIDLASHIFRIDIAKVSVYDCNTFSECGLPCGFFRARYGANNLIRFFFPINGPHDIARICLDGNPSASSNRSTGGNVTAR